MAKDDPKTKVAKKTGRRVTPARSEEDAMAAQVLAMMGEGPQMPARPQSGTPLQRATASTQLSAGDAYGGDGSLQAQTNSAIDNLGDEAFKLSGEDLLAAVGLDPDPAAGAALDKLDPEERVNLIRMMDPMQSVEEAATAAVSPQEEVMRAMGVK